MEYQQLVEVQMENEVRVIARADNKKRAQLQLQVDNEQEFNLNYGQDAVLEILPPVFEELNGMFTRKNQHTKKFYWTYVKPVQEAQRKAEKAPKMPVEQLLANIVAVQLTSSLTKETTLTSAAAVMTNLAFHNLHVPFEDRREMSRHGIAFFANLIMAVAELTDIFTIEQVDGRENRLFLSPEWEEHVKSCKDDYATDVSGYEPMVVPPKEYSNLTDSEAGYLVSPSPLLKRPTRGADKELLEAIDNFTSETNPAFFAYVNRVAKTPYVVNNKLLSHLLSFYNERQMCFAKFPRKPETELEKARALNVVQEATKKEVDARNKARQNYAEYKGIAYEPLTEGSCAKAFNDHQSRFDDNVNKVGNLLNKADKYSLFDNIYYAPFLDNRGRLYPYASGSLSTQGDEMAKALIQFSRKEKLNVEGMNAMFDTLANAMGLDKMLLPVKRQKAQVWFKKNFAVMAEGNFDLFVEDSHKPAKERIFDEPITAMAICIELVEASKDPEYLCGYICHRDARVSGSSIIGTALLDKGIMEMTSVLDWYNEENRLGDAYVKAAETALAIAKKEADSGNELAIELYSYREDLFNRSVFKHVVMTWCSYGLTDFSLREYNKEVFNWDEEDRKSVV